MVSTIATGIKCRIGEGVLYHPDEEAVYWVDIPTGEVYRYDPTTAEYEVIDVEAPIGGFTFQADGSLLLFGAEGRILNWNDGETSVVVDGLEGEGGMRFNDVIADPEGRVFAGTMSDDDHSIGRLYRVDTDGTVTSIEDRIELPNGLGFSPDEETLYLAETNTNRIYAYDYDAETGALSDRRLFSEREAQGNYDGLTVDTEGGVWVGLWDDGALIRLTTAGELDERIELPARNVTTLSFGGDDFETAYVTSASFDTDLADREAGRIFRLEMPVAGKPEHYSTIDY